MPTAREMVLLSNIAWAFSGNTLYWCLQWAVLVVLTKTLTPVDVGQFALALAITAPVFTLSNLRLRNVLATETGPFVFEDFLAARLLTTATGALACLLPLVGMGSTSSVNAIALVTVAKALDAVGDICHGLFQRQQRLQLSSIGLAINGFSSVMLVSTIASVAPSLELALSAYLAGSAIALFAWDLPWAFRLAPPAVHESTLVGRLTRIPRLLRHSAALGASSALGSVKNNVPRYAIAALLGPEPLAVFAALSYVPLCGNLIINAVGQAALPFLATELNNSPASHGSRIHRLVMVGACLGITGLLTTYIVGEKLIALIYTHDYSQHFSVLMWLMLAAAFSYTFIFFGTAATARRRFGAQLAISTLGFITIAATSFPLISWFGLNGAACAMLAAVLAEGAAYAAFTVADVRLLRVAPRLT